MTESAFIIDAVRSPLGRGRPSGALAGVHPADLLGQVLQHLVERTGVDPGAIEDVIVGCVTQTGEQSGGIGRQAVLAAGFPEHVPAVTVERKCGSSQQAIDFAVQGVASGRYDVVVAAGIESMSRVPMGAGRADGADPHGPAVRRRYPSLVSQGVAAELVAEKWGLSREALDQYSCESQQRAAAARGAGQFDDEIVAIRTAEGLVREDETIRPDTSLEGLAQLGTVFATDAYRDQFPNLDWKVTAGSSSQIADGASALLVVSERVASQLGRPPLARVVRSAAIGDDPMLMLTGPIAATDKVLDGTGLTLDDLAAIEINEAFAPVPLAWAAEHRVDPLRLNPLGGAIALGHPLGASGGRIAATLLHHLRRSGGRYGLQSMCEAGGMANATIFEALN